ncbi:MAG: transketolase family protein [Candidatus Woesearchaeota archaeon]
MSIKRQKKADYLVLFDGKKTLEVNKKEFLKKHSADGIIRVTSDDFKYFEEHNFVTHFNLETSSHKKEKTYIVLKIKERGFFDGKKEKLPVLETKKVLKFICTGVKEKVSYEKLKKLDFKYSYVKSVSSLKNKILLRYIKSLPHIKKEDLIKRGVSITTLLKITRQDSTRNGFGQGLLEAGSKNKNVYALTADLGGSTKVDLFGKKHPKRLVQVGVAEQNLVTVAAGLAHVGKIPFATSFAAFSPGRNFEQIRTTICYNNQNVKICSTHSGLGVGEDGATHQMLEDISMMRSLPNMVVIQPCDANQAKLATLAISKIKTPCYLRLHRQNSNTLSRNDFTIGKAQILAEGSDLTVISSGPIIHDVLLAAKLSNKSVEVINIHTIKPIDKNAIVKSAKKTGKVITFEDHQVFGGLGSAVSEVLSQSQPTKMKIIGMDGFGESGNYKDLFKKFGLDYKSMLKEINKF